MNARLARLLVLVAVTGLNPVPGTVASAADQPPLKIGFIASYSGDAAEQGKILDTAMQAFLKTHGTTVAGRKIEILKRDDTGIAPDVSRRLAQELIVQEKVDLLMGIVYTPNAVAVAGVSTAAKIPFLLVNASTSNIIAKAPYTTRYGMTTPQVTMPLAQWALKTGYKTAYAVFQDYGPGLDAGKAFNEAFTAGGGRMLGEVRVPITNADYNAYLQRVKDAKPDIVFVFDNATSGGPQFLKAYRDLGLDKIGIKVISLGALVDETNLPATGDAALGVISSFDYSATHNSKLNRDFVRAFKDIDPKADPDFVAVAVWDAMTAAYKVIAAQSGRIDPDKTMELLKGMKFESPRGPIMIDPDTRDIVQNVYLRRTEKINGKLVNTEFATIPMVKDPYEK
jgi:branched-chain amino acid transport system substrate-binding protein